MAIEWNSDLEIGVSEIDRQHHELIDRINILLLACGEGKGRNEVGHLIAFLEEYVMAHFAREEELMKQCNFPDYPSHKAEHDHFAGRFAELKQTFRTEGGGTHVILSAISTTVSWFSHHIRRTDKSIGQFLRNRTALRDYLPWHRSDAYSPEDHHGSVSGRSAA